MNKEARGKITSGDFKFNDDFRYVGVRGLKIAYDLFEAWGEGGMSLNTVFRLVERLYETIVIEDLGNFNEYRKLPKDKPPLLTDEKIEEAKIQAEKDYWSHRPHPAFEREKVLLQAQREADINHYETILSR